MNPLVQALSVTLPGIYLVAAVLHGMSFAGERAPRIYGARRWVLALAVGLHTLLLTLRWRDAQPMPVIDAWTSVSTVALCVALLYGWISWRTAHSGTGLHILAIVFLLQLLSSSLGPFQLAINSGGPSPFFVLHTLTTVVATSALLLSGVHGALYLWLHRQMRGHRFGAFVRGLPDLRQLAMLTRHAALTGFVLLTIGLNLGIWWAHSDAIPGFQYTDPLVLVTLGFWIYFGFVAFSRWIPGLTARRTSYAAAAGLVLLLASIVLTSVPSVSFHWQN